MDMKYPISILQRRGGFTKIICKGIDNQENSKYVINVFNIYILIFKNLHDCIVLFPGLYLPHFTLLA